MFDLPLHPVIVHFPIVLGATLPVVGILVCWAIRKDHVAPKVWVVLPAMALAFFLSSLVAMELGEDDEEKVEKVVSESLIEEHEEAAEVLPWIGGFLFVVSIAGMMKKHPEKARVAFIVLSLIAIAPLVNTGHTGGELVYQYGAATAHLPQEYKTMIQKGEKVTVPGGEAKHDDDD